MRSQNYQSQPPPTNSADEPFFELFGATHSAIEYRYPLSLKYLAERLARS
jgi:hypothetical protein